MSAGIEALGLKPGDEVIVPGYTCVVVTNSVRFAGLAPRYADIELDTYGLDFDSMVKALTPKTRAIVIHHLYGLVARDTQKILEFAKERKLFVIEDAAQSTGAQLHGQNVGNFGDVSFISLEQSKVINCILGGLALTNNSEIGQRLNQIWNDAPIPENSKIRSQLQTVSYYYRLHKHPLRWLTSQYLKASFDSSRTPAATSEEYAGNKPADYGCRMPAPIAAIASNQFSKIERYNQLRRKHAAKWDQWCDSKGLKKPVVISGSTPVYLRYPVLVEPERKKDFAWAQRELGFRPGVWFLSNVHPSAEKVSGCPNANRAVDCCINLPCLIP